MYDMGPGKLHLNLNLLQACRETPMAVAPLLCLKTLFPPSSSLETITTNSNLSTGLREVEVGILHSSPLSSRLLQVTRCLPDKESTTQSQISALSISRTSWLTVRCIKSWCVRNAVICLTTKTTIIRYSSSKLPLRTS